MGLLGREPRGCYQYAENTDQGVKGARTANLGGWRRNIRVDLLKMEQVSEWPLWLNCMAVPSRSSYQIDRRQLKEIGGNKNVQCRPPWSSEGSRQLIWVQLIPVSQVRSFRGLVGQQLPRGLSLAIVGYKPRSTPKLTVLQIRCPDNGRIVHAAFGKDWRPVCPFETITRVDHYLTIPGAIVCAFGLMHLSPTPAPVLWYANGSCMCTSSGRHFPKILGNACPPDKFCAQNVKDKPVLACDVRHVLIFYHSSCLQLFNSVLAATSDLHALLALLSLKIFRSPGRLAVVLVRLVLFPHRRLYPALDPFWEVIPILYCSFLELQFTRPRLVFVLVYSLRYFLG